MAASSNYKTYARQTRMLTEEAGFAGGMMWTDNTIDATHLKNIVNFDYDETTTFLKTRDPFISYPAKNADGGPIHLAYVNIPEEGEVRNDNLVGVYNISAVEYKQVTLADSTTVWEEDALTTSGALYVFCNTSVVAGQSTLLFRVGEVWHSVLPPIDGSLWTSSIKVDLIQHDNTLYTTVAASDKILQVYRLHDVQKQVDADTYVHDYYKLEIVPDVQELIDSVGLTAALATGWNAARGDNMFNYPSTVASTEDAREDFDHVMLRSVNDPNAVLSQPVLKQPTYLDVVLNNVHNDDMTQYVYMYKLVSGDANDPAAIWEHVDNRHVDIIRAIPRGLPIRFEYTFVNEETVLGFKWVSNANYGTYTPGFYDGGDIAPVLVVSYGYAPTTKAATVKPYKLPTAQASCLWNDRLVLWDLVDNKHTLFISAVDNFYYFPTPNNVATFETEIINCVPYLGDLLVFTSDRIHRLAIDALGAITNSVIQNDMPVTKEDASCLRVIKNMVLFKSGNYFYMVVPKSQSLTGELTIAPIYKNIAGLLNDKKQYVFETLSAMYPYRFTADDVTINDTPSYVYTEQDTVRILYTVEVRADVVVDDVLNANKLFKYMLFLNYNTNLRAWTAYIEDTSELTLAPAALTAARNTEFVRVDNTNCLLTSLMQPDTRSENAVHCMLDTGYRSLSGAVKKRFREIQLKLYSGTENVTVFNSAFYLDGQTRKCYNKLEEAFVDNVQRIVTLAPTFEPNAFLLEDTMALDKYGNLVSQNEQQGSDRVELSNWQLDFSHFKRNAVSTLRIPVSGKGYSPRFILMSEQGIALYINEINWVYRMLYGR